MTGMHCAVTDICIRPLNNQKYVATVQNFLFQAIKKDFGFDYIPEYHQDIIRLESYYIHPERNAFLVAFLSDTERIIGSLGISVYDRNYPEFKDRYDSTHTANFGRAMVDSEFRRMGVGTALVREGEHFCQKKEYSRIYLHTQKNVPGALPFWLKNGFKVTLDTHNWLSTVHMEKELTTIDRGNNTVLS